MGFMYTLEYFYVNLTMLLLIRHLADTFIQSDIETGVNYASTIAAAESLTIAPQFYVSSGGFDVIWILNYVTH